MLFAKAQSAKKKHYALEQLIREPMMSKSDPLRKARSMEVYFRPGADIIKFLNISLSVCLIRAACSRI